MTTITIKDYGRPVYLDGAQMQFCVLRGPHSVIAYCGSLEDARTIAHAFGDEVIIEAPE